MSWKQRYRSAHSVTSKSCFNQCIVLNTTYVFVHNQRKPNFPLTIYDSCYDRLVLMTLNIWLLFYFYENIFLTLTFPRTQGLLFYYFLLLKPTSESKNEGYKISCEQRIFFTIQTSILILTVRLGRPFKPDNSEIWFLEISSSWIWNNYSFV